MNAQNASCTCRCYSRVGLLGNPSDGYHGKVISFLLKNFYCEVAIEPSAAVRILPNLEEDGHVHESLDALSKSMQLKGYTGGLQLLLATCRVFKEHCLARNIELPSWGFTLSYKTNIPRQCGLSGSSAIILATLDCLVRFHGVDQLINAEDKPGLALAAESELGITAGLQDRIIQTFGGLMSMDFSDASSHKFASHDHTRLPDMYVIYSDEPSHSGAIHSDAKQRWNRDEGGVREAMSKIASLAEQGRSAIDKQDWFQLAELMDANFKLRRQIFGDKLIGTGNLCMVQTVKAHGGSAKLTGSGGAVIALFPAQDAKEIEECRIDCGKKRFRMIKAVIAPAH